MADSRVLIFNTAGFSRMLTKSWRNFTVIQSNICVCLVKFDFATGRATTVLKTKRTVILARTIRSYNFGGYYCSSKSRNVSSFKVQDSVTFRSKARKFFKINHFNSPTFFVWRVIHLLQREYSGGEWILLVGVKIMSEYNYYSLFDEKAKMPCEKFARYSTGARPAASLIWSPRNSPRILPMFSVVDISNSLVV